MSSNIKARVGGRGMRLSIGGPNATLVKVEGYTPHESSTEHDITNSESYDEDTGRTAVERTDGIDDLEMDIELLWDAGQNPYDDPPNFVIGAHLEDVYFYVNRGDDTYYYFSEFILFDCTTPIKVKETIKQTIKGKTNGAWTKPTGSV